MGTTFLVAIFYCLDALYGERRDRSILFWKSLPISDLTTVLSKASVPPRHPPAAHLGHHGGHAVPHAAPQPQRLPSPRHRHRPLRTGLPLTQNAMMLLYHLIAIHALWYAPIWAWFLLVSAWARRTPLLWAALPPFALGVLKMITLHSGHVFEFLKYRFHGPEGADFEAPHTMARWPCSLSPAHFFATPGLWAGLALAAVFLAAAIQLRRYRNPL